MYTQLELTKLTLDPAIQQRVTMSEPAIAAYMEDMNKGDVFPPIVVFHDGTLSSIGDYFVADGFHRYTAARRQDRKTIACEVHQGTKRDAILWAVGANRTHGVRGSDEDIFKAVMTLLKDEEWGRWSSNQIAEKCRVSATTVNKYRKLHADELPNNGASRVTKRGYTMNTTRIGKEVKKELQKAPEVVQELAQTLTDRAQIHLALPAVTPSLVRSAVEVASEIANGHGMVTHDGSSPVKADTMILAVDGKPIIRNGLTITIADMKVLQDQSETAKRHAMHKLEGKPEARVNVEVTIIAYGFDQYTVKPVELDKIAAREIGKVIGAGKRYKAWLSLYPLPDEESSI